MGNNNEPSYLKAKHVLSRGAYEIILEELGRLYEGPFFLYFESTYYKKRNRALKEAYRRLLRERKDMTKTHIYHFLAEKFSLSEDRVRRLLQGMP